MPAAQVPVPLQAGTGSSVPPVQAATPQVVPAAHLRQAPAPSQKPSLPQEVAVSAVQSLRTSVPETAGVHWPRVPTPPQVMQAPRAGALAADPIDTEAALAIAGPAAGGAVRLLRRADPRRAEIAGRAIGVGGAGRRAGRRAAHVRGAGSGGGRQADARAVALSRQRVRRAAARFVGAAGAGRVEPAGAGAIAGAVVAAGGDGIGRALAVGIRPGGDRTTEAVGCAGLGVRASAAGRPHRPIRSRRRRRSCRSRTGCLRCTSRRWSAERCSAPPTSRRSWTSSRRSTGKMSCRTWRRKRNCRRRRWLPPGRFPRRRRFGPACPSSRCTIRWSTPCR